MTVALVGRSSGRSDSQSGSGNSTKASRSAALQRGADAAEVDVLGIDAHVSRDAELVAPYDHQIQRQPDRQVRLDGRIHRYQGALGRLVEAAAAADGAIDDRFAVLGLADLEISGFGQRLDEVPGRVDAEQPGTSLRIWPPRIMLALKLDAEFLERGGIAAMYFAQRLADAARRFEHVGGGLQIQVRLVAAVLVFAQQRGPLPV